jgi:hypothetical protein
MRERKLTPISTQHICVARKPWATELLHICRPYWLGRCIRVSGYDFLGKDYPSEERPQVLASGAETSGSRHCPLTRKLNEDQAAITNYHLLEHMELRFKRSQRDKRV